MYAKVEGKHQYIRIESDVGAVPKATLGIRDKSIRCEFAMHTGCRCNGERMETTLKLSGIEVNDEGATEIDTAIDCEGSVGAEGHFRGTCENQVTYDMSHS